MLNFGHTKWPSEIRSFWISWHAIFRKKLEASFSEFVKCQKSLYRGNMQTLKYERKWTSIRIWTGIYTRVQYISHCKIKYSFRGCLWTSHCVVSENLTFMCFKKLDVHLLELTQPSWWNQLIPFYFIHDQKSNLHHCCNAAVLAVLVHIRRSAGSKELHNIIRAYLVKEHTLYRNGYLTNQWYV